MWTIKRGPLSGGRPPQDAWNIVLFNTYEQALEILESWVRMGCAVHAFLDPAGNVLMNENDTKLKYK
jgi:hypothetical protein